MKSAPSFTWGTLFGLLLVLTCAAGARIGYVTYCADTGLRNAVLQVQGDRQGFKCLAPLAEKEELTAHLAPGYPWLFGMMASRLDNADQVMRWLQCALGSVTVACYFFFARRAFHNCLIATVTGLLMAFYPFWIVNTTELNDGTLVGFLLAACLMFGTRAGHTGSAPSSLLFGLTLAGLVMVRAAVLPFALAALLWFLWRCRRFPMGWYAGILALAGFANVAPWVLFTYYQYGRPVPIATSTYYHLWMGNNPSATGGPMDEQALRATLTEDRLQQCLAEPNQAKRYDLLADVVLQEIVDHPAETLTRRFGAALAFLFGDNWFKQKRFAVTRAEGAADMPAELLDHADVILSAALLALFALALLGWRWSCAWRTCGRLGTIAAVWVPLPYILSHAEALSGPRLPLDGVLLCYAAYALASFIPGAVRDRAPSK